MRPAPPQLAAIPQSWYRVCHARDLRRQRVISWTLGSRAIVVYRTEGGRVVAMDARCPHLGAHLGRGTVRGDELQCALHHWTCGPTGVCRAPSGSGRLSHTVYATAERYGSIFLFAGSEPRFDVPQLGDDRTAAPPRVLAGHPVLVETSWAALAMNAFDIAHMDAIHHRVPREEPEIRLRGSDCLELKYVSRITGSGLSDRVMRWLSSDRVTATIECWGGTMIVVRSRVGTLESRLLLCLTPQGNHVTVVPIVARPRSGWPIVEALALRIGRWLFTSFLARDVVPLAGMDLRIDRAIDLPGPGGWCARWLLTLPAFVEPDNRTRSSVQTLEAVPRDLSLVPTSHARARVGESEG